MTKILLLLLCTNNFYSVAMEANKESQEPDIIIEKRLTPGRLFVLWDVENFTKLLPQVKISMINKALKIQILCTQYVPIEELRRERGYYYLTTFLSNQKVDLNDLDERGRKPLDYLYYKSDRGTLEPACILGKLLIKHGADPRQTRCYHEGLPGDRTDGAKDLRRQMFKNWCIKKLNWKEPKQRQ